MVVSSATLPMRLVLCIAAHVCTFMCEPGKQDIAEHSPLGGGFDGDHCGGGAVADSHPMESPRQEAKDPST